MGGLATLKWPARISKIILVPLGPYMNSWGRLSCIFFYQAWIWVMNEFWKNISTFSKHILLFFCGNNCRRRLNHPVLIMTHHFIWCLFDTPNFQICCLFLFQLGFFGSFNNNNNMKTQLKMVTWWCLIKPFLIFTSPLILLQIMIPSIGTEAMAMIAPNIMRRFP